MAAYFCVIQEFALTKASWIAECPLNRVVQCPILKVCRARNLTSLRRITPPPRPLDERTKIGKGLTRGIIALSLLLSCYAGTRALNEAKSKKGYEYIAPHPSANQLASPNSG
jgi:hypothetical protein